MTATRMPSYLVLGAVALFTLLLVAGGAMAILNEVAEDTRVSQRALGDVKSIDLASDEGDVEVRTVGAGEEPTLRVVEERGLFGGPDVNVTTEGGRIEADSDCWALVFGNSCTVRWIVSVPRGTPVRVRTGSGDVLLGGTVGATDVDTGSGDIEIRGAEGPALRAHTGSGDVEAAGARVERLDARTGSGDIELPGLAAKVAELDASSGDIEVRAASALERLVAETGSGDIDIAAPGGPYAVSTDTGSGEARVSIPTDPGASAQMRLKTGSGDIDVRGR